MPRAAKPDLSEAFCATCGQWRLAPGRRPLGPRPAAAEVSVRAWDTPQALHFTIGDTGRGFDPNATANGTGLTNMHNRIAALGTLAVHSRPWHGTRLHGTIPDPMPGAAAGRRPPAYQAPSPADLGGLSA
jgi:hypothetical protein